MAERQGLHDGVTRRAFLKTSAALGAGAGVAAQVAGGQMTALAENTEIPEEKEVYNMCRGNCGSTVCRNRGIIREGKLVQIKPAPIDWNHIDYKTGCVKGQFYPQRLYSPSRVLYPMKRVGERGSGQFERISWDEAFELASSTFLKATAEYGPAATGIWQSYGAPGSINGPGWYFPYSFPTAYSITMVRFVYATGCGVICPGADLTQMWMNATWSLASASPIDMLDSRTLIFWAYNLAETSRDSWQYAMEAKDNGATLICIDPRFSTTAAGSHTWVPIRPATDGAMMLAMANYIVENHLEDEDFLRSSTVAPYLQDATGAYLRLSTAGMDMPVTVGADGTETPQDDIVVWDEETESFMGSLDATKPAIHGTFTAPNGVVVQTTLDYVMGAIAEFTMEKAEGLCGIPREKIEYVARTYATNKPAAICSYQGLGHHYNSRHNYKNLQLLAALTGNAYKPGAFNNINPLNVTNVLQGNTNVAAYCQVENPKSPAFAFTSQRIVDVMRTGKLNSTDVPLKWVMIHAANPLSSESGRKDLIEAVSKLDFFLVMDPYMSDTAKYADLILPVTLSWEQLDTTGGFALFDKGVEPAGEAREPLEIFRGLAAGIGYPNLYPMNAEEYVRAILDTPENRENGFTFDDYRREGYIFKYQEGTVTELAGSSYGASKLQFYQEYQAPKEASEAVLDQTIERRPYWEPGLECNNPQSAEFQKYPLFGISKHDNYHAHSMITDCSWQRELAGGPELIMSEAAAEERGIKTGDLVRAYNDRGECVLKAVVTKGIQPETVVFPHGWQSRDYIKGHHQDLTRSEMDPVCFNNAYYEIMCDVEKWNGEE